MSIFVNLMCEILCDLLCCHKYILQGAFGASANMFSALRNGDEDFWP